MCSNVRSYAGQPLRTSIDVSSFWLETQSQSGLTADERIALQAAFSQANTATAAPSITVAVWQAGGMPWTQTSGTPEGHVHYWASVGKLVTASAILKLLENGRLSMDDAISKYVEDVPNGDIITLRMLLNHTSGLFSANETEQMHTDGLQLDLDNVLEVINRQPPYACPGEMWRYSNSGYILLSAVIENITDQPYHVAAYDLVLARSAGRDIRLVGPNGSLDRVVLPEKQPNMPTWDIREPRGAGVAVASAESMALFLRDLLSGRILQEETVAQMLEDLYPMFQDVTSYGAGIMVYDVPATTGPQLWIGHSGGAPGARALLVYYPAKRSIVAVAMTGEGSADATANILFGSLDGE
jgi:D-alanyl-D-alanine carboxypeptidase